MLHGSAGAPAVRGLVHALRCVPMRILMSLLFLLPSCAIAQDWSARALGEIAIYPEFRAPATVVAVEEARIAAEVGARIVAMPARTGVALARDAELVRLDDAAFRIELDRARAQVALIDSRIGLARAQLDQARALAGRGFISADGLRIRETELGVLQRERDAARAAEAAAELALARTVIRAPFAGVVRERLAAVGDLAAPGTPLLSLAASADAEVHARVPAAQVDGLLAAVPHQQRAGRHCAGKGLLFPQPVGGAGRRKRRPDRKLRPAGRLPHQAGGLRRMGGLPLQPHHGVKRT